MIKKLSLFFDKESVEAWMRWFIDLFSLSIVASYETYWLSHFEIRWLHFTAFAAVIVFLANHSFSQKHDMWAWDD